jgi:hypothetical protein
MTGVCTLQKIEFTDGNATASSAIVKTPQDEQVKVKR